MSPNLELILFLTQLLIGSFIYSARMEIRHLREVTKLKNAEQDRRIEELENFRERLIE